MLNEIYIPDNLFNNVQNSFLVGELLEKYYSTDMILLPESETIEENFLKELKKIPEPKVHKFFYELLKGENND